MKAFHPETIAVAALIYSVVIDAVVAQQPTVSYRSPNKCNAPYAKSPPGISTYDIDDGGCYMCSRHPGAQVEIPLTGEYLEAHCKMMCEADSQCVSFSVARPAALPAQKYYYGVESNCCLERRADYPPGVFVDATKTMNGQSKKTNCQMDTMCWTRYEKKFERGQDGKKIASKSPTCGGEEPAVKVPSAQCQAVWPANTYSDEEIQGKIDFIARGCVYNDTTFTALLSEAHDQCRDEIFAESMTTTVIVLPTVVYTHVNIDNQVLKAYG